MFSFSVAMFDFLGPQFTHLWTWEVDCWSLKPLSSKISQYLSHYFHPFPSPLTSYHVPSHTHTHLWILLDSSSRGQEDVFPIELWRCMCQHMDLYCGFFVVVGPGLHDAVVGRGGVWLFYFAVLSWPGARNTATLMFDGAWEWLAGTSQPESVLGSLGSV